MALANLAAQDGSTPVIRYLVLEEIRGVLREHTAELDASLIERAECFAAQARALVLAQLSGELGADDPRAAELLAWFGDKLAAVDARTP
jgi:hypothetical protein